MRVFLARSVALFVVLSVPTPLHGQIVRQNWNGNIGELAAFLTEPSLFGHSIAGTGALLGPQQAWIFEADIAPHVYAYSVRRRWGVEVMPRVQLRMLAENSAPVRTPGYQPTLRFFWWGDPNWNIDALGAGRVKSFWSAQLTHHSNGQEGPFLTPGTDDHNHVDGSFSTNFVRLQYNQFRLGGIPLVGGGIHILSLGAEAHPGFNQSDELAGRYGRYRVLVSERFIAQGTKWDPEVFLRLTALFEGVAEGTDPFSIEVIGKLRPQMFYQWAFFARIYRGPDYYNIRFDREVTLLQIGLSADFVSIARFGT